MYWATGMPLTAAPAATSSARIWSVTATFTAPAVAVDAADEGDAWLVVVDGVDVVVVDRAAADVVVVVLELFDDELHPASASAPVATTAPTIHRACLTWPSVPRRRVRLSARRATISPRGPRSARPVGSHRSSRET